MRQLPTLDECRRLLPATLRDEWAVVEPLDTGGQGLVIKIRGLKGAREAVLKLLKKGNGIEGTERFVQDIKILQSIEHPNIVRLLADGRDATPPWYITPLGVPFDKYWLERRTKLSPEDLFTEARQVVLALLSGLACFHGAGGVHRDIKPSNVLVLNVGSSNEPVLIDFGYAFRRDSPSITPENKLVRPNTFGGPAEAYYGYGDDPPAAWDCYSMACLWAWMLAKDARVAFGHYHWKHHRFIAHAKCDLVRGVLAICSESEFSPRNAKEMSGLVQVLLPSDNVPATTGASDFSASRQASAEEGLERKMKLIARSDRFRTAAALLSPPYDHIQEGLLRTVKSAIDAGHKGFIEVPAGRNATALLAEAAQNPRQFDVSIPLFKGYLGAHPNDGEPCFEISLMATFDEGCVGDLLPFTLKLELNQRHRVAPSAGHSYGHARDGVLWLRKRESGGPPDCPVNKTHPIDEVDSWIKDPVYWGKTASK